MPDNWRPDKLKIIMRSTVAYGYRIVSFWETEINALRNEEIMKFVKTTLTEGAVVVLRRKDTTGQYTYYWSPVFPSKDVDPNIAELLMPILKKDMIRLSIEMLKGGFKIRVQHLQPN
ncbi:MAG: hypothetical protein UZ19_OD1000914 [Parcubacteria bacterium OLB19]|nr:MAG: hypothetical protein UZ19_OD1000914 [Parcubacteria bacterium OLB19]